MGDRGTEVGGEGDTCGGQADDVLSVSLSRQSSL